MAALNEITAEIDHILFTCNCFVRFRKRTQRACSWRKAVSKISANFSNCDGIYSQKRIISTTGECALKNNFATFVFLYCDLISLISPWKYLFFFSTCVFFHNHSQIKGLQEKSGVMSLTHISLTRFTDT